MLLIPMHKSVSEIADLYDTFLLDIWGVIHDGSILYPGVKECFIELKKRNKNIILISNSSALGYQLEKDLEDFGIDNTFYDGIFTAGATARHLIENKQYDWLKNTNNKYYHVGSVNRANMLDGLDCERTHNIEEATFILLTGFAENAYHPENYEPLLKKASTFKIPLICTNPDIITVKQDNTERICPGFIAKIYEDKYNGESIYIGKPYPEIYKFCLENSHIPDLAKAIVIGDTLEVDIKGAIQAEIKSILNVVGVTKFHVTRTIKNPTPEDFVNYCIKQNILPNGILSGFRW